MSDVAAYHVLVCALFPVQGGMWTAVDISLTLFTLKHFHCSYMFR